MIGFLLPLLFPLSVFAWDTNLPNGIVRVSHEDPQSRSTGPSLLQDETTCTAVDLLNGAPLISWTETRNQAPFDWCGSFALADVLSKKLGKNVSGLHLGAKYQDTSQEVHRSRSLQIDPSFAKPEIDRRRPLLPSENINTDFGVGGLSCDLLRSVKKNGYCTMDALEGKGTTAKDLREIAKSAREIVRLQRGLAHVQSVPRIYAKCPFPSGSDMHNIWSIVNDANSTNYRKMMADYVEMRCRGATHQAPDELTCKYTTNSLAGTGGGARVGIANDIDKALEKGVMPIVGLDQRHLSSSGAPYARSGHAVSLNARRWNSQKGRCEYRIRNSLPDLNCSHYSSDLSCDPEEIKTGQVWVSGSKLDQITEVVAFIE